MRVLVADGDRRMLSSLTHALSDHGHVVDVALYGEHALWHAIEFDYDVVILDARLPGLDGVQVGLRLRERKPSTPILMLVSQDDDLNTGGHGAPAIADAYATKPVDLTALTAQLSALTRVDPEPRPRELGVGDLWMSPSTHRARRGDHELDLSPREFALLKLFMSHPGEALTRQDILDRVWARHRRRAPNLVDQYVLYLRRKIDRPFGIDQIETVRAVGYRLRERPVTVEVPRYLGATEAPVTPELVGTELWCG